MTTKEVLQLVKKRLIIREETTKRGLFICNEIKNLVYDEFITEEDKDKTIAYLDRNRPHNSLSGLAWYEPRDLDRRIKWLDRHINQ